MAEFCLRCYNRMFHKKLKESDVVLDSALDICEGCGKYRHTVIAERGLFSKLFYLITKFIKSRFTKK